MMMIEDSQYMTILTRQSCNDKEGGGKRNIFYPHMLLYSVIIHYTEMYATRKRQRDATIIKIRGAQAIVKGNTSEKRHRVTSHNFPDIHYARHGASPIYIYMFQEK